MSEAPVVHVVAAGEVGGAERLLARLAAPRAGARPHVVALFTDDAALAALFRDAGVETLTPPARPGPRLTTRLRATGGPDVGWLADTLVERGAAAVHLHTFASHVLGARAGLRAGVPVVRTEHSRRVYDNWLCRPFSAWSLRRATRVVAVSDDLGRLVRARHPEVADRLAVIRNGVPLPSTVAEPPDDGPLRLSLVARLEPRKGVDVALRALARVPDVRLDVVGDGPERAALDALARELGVDARVHFWGYRPDPEVVVAAADAALCSSRTEGLPLGVLEAMAGARPVVAVPVGGVPEVVTDGETGWLAREATLDALVAQVRLAAHAGRAELRRRGDNARRDAVARFGDATMHDAYEALYAALPVRTASARARPPARPASSRTPA